MTTQQERWTIIFLYCLFLSAQGFAQIPEANPYHLPIITTLSDYKKSCEQDSNNILVDLKDYIPGIRLDIRYATFENFTGSIIYPEAKAFARLPVAKALRMIQQELSKRGNGLKIFDAYRPYSATLKFWDIVQDTLFVAAPWKGSRHNRGCAIDVSLIDLTTGEELAMPTPYDDFTPNASPNYQDLPGEIQENRDFLIHLMSKYGFSVLESEWWHFDFKGWDRFELMDIPFGELGK
ncbi:MAG: M15 family metallopeptidase [Bacteroidales bacterium]|nr:M15 family metallopeptidase [Bacteroidales bacterium]